MNASYQASLVNRHIRRFTGTVGISSLDSELKNTIGPAEAMPGPCGRGFVAVERF